MCVRGPSCALCLVNCWQLVRNANHPKHPDHKPVEMVPATDISLESSQGNCFEKVLYVPMLGEHNILEISIRVTTNHDDFFYGSCDWSSNNVKKSVLLFLWP